MCKNFKAVVMFCIFLFRTIKRVTIQLYLDSIVRHKRSYIFTLQDWKNQYIEIFACYINYYIVLLKMVNLF